MHVVQLRGAPFDDLLPEWAELFANDPLTTPYMAPGWAFPWWRHYGDDKRALIVEVRSAGELVGLAPLAVTRRGPLRVLGALGKEPADYWDVLAQPAARAQVIEAVAETLVSSAGEWDVLDLRGLMHTSPTVQALQDRLAWRVDRKLIACPGMELPGSFDEYLAGFSSRHRRKVRRALDPIDSGILQLEEVRDRDEIATAIRSWHAMRLRQWDERGAALDPAHRETRFRDFVAAMASELVPEGRALVWRMHHDGRLAGVFVNLVDERRFYWYLGAYEPDLHKLAVGKAAIALSIRRSIEAGVGYFDFTVGEEPYKYELGASDRFNATLIGGSNRPRSRAAWLGISGRALAKGIR